MPFGRTLANTLSSVVISHGQLLLTAAFDVDLRTWVFWALPAAGDTAKGWGGGFLGCKGKLFCSCTEHLRIWVKFFSFRIHWISNQVASAEVIYMTLFPFSQANVLSCSRQKLIKLCQRNMIFFHTSQSCQKAWVCQFCF